jgi:MFS family permease
MTNDTPQSATESAAGGIKSGCEDEAYPTELRLDAVSYEQSPSRANGSGVTTNTTDDITPMKRIAVACIVGTAIETYDFIIYAAAAALVFPAVYFPHLSPAMATIASMGTYVTAFLSRPFGAVVFGHFGDRLGRKRTLVATLLMMALSTVSVGLVPSTANIGAAAPLILIALRLLQGFAIGGEWAGSALLAAEYAPAAKRGWYGMFTPLGSGAAAVLASLTFLTVNYTIGENSPAFLQWGWRIPFLISAVLIGIGVYVRLNINETPLFAEEKARNTVRKAPVAEVLRLQRREVVLAAGSFLGAFTLSFMGGSYLAAYAHTNLGYSRNLMLFVGVLTGLAQIAAVVLSAALCDRVGRRRIVLAGLAGCLAWSFVAIPLMDTGKPFCYAVAMLGMQVVATIALTPMATFIPELFATRYRYSGAALATNIASIAGGVAPPLIAGALQATYGGWAVGAMLAAYVVVSLVCTYLLPETKGTALQSV